MRGLSAAGVYQAAQGDRDLTSLRINRKSSDTKKYVSADVNDDTAMKSRRVYLGWCGAGERNRTSNLRFTKPLLCRLSYASLRVVGNNEPAEYSPHSINSQKSLSRNVILR